LAEVVEVVHVAALVSLRVHSESSSWVKPFQSLLVVDDVVAGSVDVHNDVVDVDVDVDAVGRVHMKHDHAHAHDHAHSQVYVHSEPAPASETGQEVAMMVVEECFY